MCIRDRLSGVVEPIAGVIGALIALQARMLLPFLLAFAAGAMIYVVVAELIPESQTNEKKDIMALFTLVGFSIMMILDVALGLSLIHILENQQQCDIRFPLFNEIPATKKFIISEPLLSDIDMSAYLNKSISQVLVGGESGANARICLLYTSQGIVDPAIITSLLKSHTKHLFMFNSWWLIFWIDLHNVIITVAFTTENLLSLISIARCDNAIADLPFDNISSSFITDIA